MVIQLLRDGRGDGSIAVATCLPQHTGVTNVCCMNRFGELADAAEQSSLVKIG